MRCRACRDGYVGSPEWLAWWCRADEVQAELLALRATQGDLGDVEASEAWQRLLDERPTCEEEQDCPVCGGTGIVADQPEALLAVLAR